MSQTQFAGPPLRVASIDVGSNALRLLMLEFEGPSQYVILGFERVPVRLARGLAVSGQLAPDAMEGALLALASFRNRMDSLGIVHCRAVGTSALRDGENGNEFVERAHHEAGIHVRVIDGNEEARLVHLAVCHRMRLGHRIWMLADVGGGSVEVSLVDDRDILWSETHPIGSVRLLEKAASGGSNLLSQYIEDFASRLRIPSPGPAGFIATGGSAVALAAVAGHRAGADGVSRVPLSDLGVTIGRLSSLSASQRVAELSIGEDRADVILPAAMLYHRLAMLADTQEILVPNVGVREGVALDLVQELRADSSWAA